MNKREYRKLADMLTWSRLISVLPISIALIFGYVTTALIIYVLALITDFIDGHMARRGVRDPSGAEFDGLVDGIFLGLSVWWIALLGIGFFTTYKIETIIVISAWIVYALVSLVKTGSFITPHLYSGKTGMALLALTFPLATMGLILPWYVWLLTGVFVLGRLEAIIYVLQGRIERNIRSIFYK